MKKGFKHFVYTEPFLGLSAMLIVVTAATDNEVVENLDAGACTTWIHTHLALPLAPFVTLDKL